MSRNDVDQLKTVKGLLEFLVLREIHTSVRRSKKKTRLCVKECGIFRGITIARL